PHGLLDGAAVFVRVRTIGIGAERHIGPKFREKPFNLFRQDVPELKLPDAGSIDNPPAEIELQKLRRGRRVPAFLVSLAHLAHVEAQARLDGVQQGRLPDAALPGEDCLTIPKPLAQALNALSRDHTREKGGNPQLAVGSDEWLVVYRIDAVRLVQTDERLDSA